MNCLRCSASNTDEARFCGLCQARLPRVAFESRPGLEMDDATHYLLPEKPYCTEHLGLLIEAAYDYLEEDQPLEHLVAIFEQVGNRLERFSRVEAPAWLSSLSAEQLDDPERTSPRQTSYLVRMASFLYAEGMARFRRFLDEPQPDLLLEAIGELQRGNDHLGLARELLEVRLAVVQEELKRRGVAA